MPWVSKPLALVLSALGATALFICIFPWATIATIAAVGTLAAAALGYGYYRLRAARPLLQGKLAVAGLKLPVKIDRDAEGVRRWFRNLTMPRRIAMSAYRSVA